MATDLIRPIAVHHFASTGDAYDACQISGEVISGDVLVIESEGVVGVAYTWPFAVTPEAGELHQLGPSADEVRAEFAESIKVAEAEAAKLARAATDLILTPAQAQAVYSAMCALASCGSTTLDLVLPPAQDGTDIRIVSNVYGVMIEHRTGKPGFPFERYADQAAFAAAYGLRQSRAVDAETRDEIQTIAGMAQDARRDYGRGKRFTSNDTDTSTCMTIRVPVAMLNRIRELAQAHDIHVA